MEPNYVYVFKELINYPKNEKWELRSKIRNIYLILLLIIFVFSLIFKDNLLFEMNWIYRIILICIGLALCNTGGYKKTSSDVELQFYNDYMIVYRHKIAYNPKKIRREYEKCYYSDIKNIEYRTNTNRLNIDAKYEGTYFNYKHEVLEEKPSYHKTVNSLIWFYPEERYQKDLLETLEKYTNITINVKEGV